MSLLKRIEQGQGKPGEPRPASPADSGSAGGGGANLSSLQARRVNAPAPSTQAGSYFDLKTRVQNKLLAELDPSLDITRTEDVRKTILELFEHQRSGRLGGWASHDAMRDQFYAYLPQRAREHGFYALFVNQAGQPHPALRFEGPSFAVGPRGEILAETKDGSQQMLLAEIA